ncbi:MAG: hypothetical protein RRA15_02920 [bacterium]|nr:hypothetical protein [bacterium]
MPDKPLFAADYTPGMTEVATATLLYIATTLGDLMDQIVLVGGLVPTLIVPDRPHVEAHVGTTDVDLGLSIALLDMEQYREVSRRLRRAGFEPDASDQGNPTRQRWVCQMEGMSPGLVDFLIQPSGPDSIPGRLQNLENDFAAIITKGLHLAFQDYLSVRVAAKTVKGETAEREIRVCGPGAFIVLKALSVRGRNEPKDSYDLHHVVRYYGESVDDVVQHLLPLLDAPVAQETLGFLAEDFREQTSIGPSRAAAFLGRSEDVDFKADVAGDIRELLQKCGFET